MLQFNLKYSSRKILSTYMFVLFSLDNLCFLFVILLFSIFVTFGSVAMSLSICRLVAILFETRWLCYCLTDLSRYRFTHLRLLFSYFNLFKGDQITNCSWTLSKNPTMCEYSINVFCMLNTLMNFLFCLIILLHM